MEKAYQIKVMIVGDLLIFRSGLKVLLETHANFKVAGEAASLEEASEQIKRTQPDVFVIDSSQIDVGDFDQFATMNSAAKPVLVLSSSKNIAKHRAYLQMGVDGLFFKDNNAETFFKAIERVSRGDVWFDRRLMGDTIKQLTLEMKSIPERVFSYNCAVLTTREREVLMLICRGMKNKTIAESLFITETTVRHHLTSIFEKLKVTSRLELVVHAFNERLVEIPIEKSIGNGNGLGAHAAA